jgi:NAD(P)-dependent dehydrogenase (short-subunit alcohol dehydrogenase family)
MSVVVITGANAGITWRARLLDVTPANLHRVNEVNVTGALLAIQPIAPLMTTGGSIVLVGSAAALTGHFPVAYTASKRALRGLAKAACLEPGARGIRVNTIHPGYIETPMTASAAPAFKAANLAEPPWAALAPPTMSRRWSRSCSASMPRLFPAPRSRSTAE